MSNINFLASSTNLISTDSGMSVRFRLTNDSDKVLNLYWIDRSGNATQYSSLTKGQSFDQVTSSSHAWEIKSTDGSIDYKFLPENGLITLNNHFQPVFTDYSEKVIQTPNGLWSTAQGYGLIDAAKSLGVADVTDLAMNGQNNNMALNAINAPAAWAAGFTGKGVKVAVLDVGIANNAEINGKIVAAYDFYDKDSTATPDAGAYKDHALGVASIIAASHDEHNGRDTMGVAPDASLINVRVGSSQYGSTSDAMASGIRYAVDQGAKVICMPLQSTQNSVDKQVVDAVHYAFTHNVVTVIIGGNFSSYGATGPAMIAEQLKGEVIDVGNFNVMSGSPFESSNMPGAANPFPWVMASSSGWVPNSDGGYSYWADGGTSFAGPYVAGVAALLWQQNPNATAADIINKITAGASVGENAATLVSAVQGTHGNDVLKAVSGIAVNAGEGVDTVQFAGHKNDYTIASSKDGFIVTHNSDHVATSLVNVERLSFDDAHVAVDISGNGGEVFRLYQAAFDRAPDQPGLGFWMNAMDHGKSLHDVAVGFVNSGEFQKLYGANPSDEQLVNAMYHNVLHREADTEGLKFWLGEMHKGMDDAQLLVSFSESAENQTAAVQIIGQGFDYIPV